jgi:hypothetical protein
MRYTAYLIACGLALSPVVTHAGDGKPAKAQTAKSETAKSETAKTEAAETKPAASVDKDAKAGPLTELPARLTVKQRTTATVPGSDDKLTITVDDITRGQVITSVSHSKHGVLIGPTSFRVGDAKQFEIESTAYRIRLKSLNNALIGNDFGEFVISYPPKPIPEEEKIARLIDAIEKLPEGTTFERNGKVRSPKEEAEFLRRRAETWKDKNLTAEAFIERLCAKASDEKPYQIRHSGLAAVSMESGLRSQLREIENDD